MIQHPDAGSSRLTYLGDLTPDGRPAVLDSQRMQWRFVTPGNRVQRMLHLQALSPMPRHVLGSIDPTLIASYRHQVTSSPWRIDLWDPDRIELVPAENWTGPPEFSPKLDRVVLRIIPDTTTRLEELKAGRLDIVSPALWSDAEAIRQDHPEIRVVRRALARAVDVEALLAIQYPTPDGEAPLAYPAVGSISPALSAHADDIVRIPHDPDGARAELAVLGWQDTDGDGVLDRDGLPFQITLLVSSSSRSRTTSANTIQRNLKAIGVRVSIHQRIYDRNFDAVLIGYQTDPIANPTIAWHSDSYTTFNLAAFSDPEVDQLIEISNQQTDLVMREAALKTMQHRIYDAQPYLFLWWFEEILLAHERVKNLQPELALQVGMESWEVSP